MSKHNRETADRKVRSRDWKSIHCTHRA
jgi:hypothetical protein